MVNDFEEEAHLIEKKDNVHDKLMIMAIYNEIFHHLKYSMSEYYRACYEAFMHDSFEEVIQDVHDAKDFVSKYILRLKKNRLTHDVKGVLENLNYFEEMKDDLDTEFDWVPIIDKYDIPFDIKVKIIVLFRNYVHDLVGRTYKALGNNEACREMINDTISYLIIAIKCFLDEWMSHNIDPHFICNSLEDVLKMAAKAGLTKMFVNGKFNFELIESESLRNYFLSYRKMEQKVLLLNMVHGISGYQDGECIEERTTEKCKVLGISKARYHLTNFSLSLRQVMLIKKDAKEKSIVKEQKNK